MTYRTAASVASVVVEVEMAAASAATKTKSVVSKKDAKYKRRPSAGVVVNSSEFSKESQGVHFLTCCVLVHTYPTQERDG